MHSSKRFHWMPFILFFSVLLISADTVLAAVSEFRVNTYTTNFQTSPSVSMNDDGNFVIVWQSNLQDLAGYAIYAQRFDHRGNPVGNEFRVNTTTASNQMLPSVSLNTAGSFVVAWQSFDQDAPGGYGVYAQRYDPSGNPQGTEFKVNTHTADFQQNPSVSLNAAGNFVIAWESLDQDEAGGWGIYAQRFDSGGNPQGNEFKVNTYTASSQLNASVSLNDAGDFAIAWQSLLQDGAGWGIYTQRYDPSGNPQGSEFKVNTHTAGSQQNPSVSLNAAGNFVIAWESFGQDAPGGYGVYAQRFDSSGNSLGSEFKVNTHTAENQQNPSVSLNAAGNFVIAWNSNLQDTSFQGIYAQRYDPSGNPLGSEFKVNTYITNAQSGPSVCLNTAGNLVIAWHSDGQDGDGFGIYAQRYDPSGNLVGSDVPVNNYTASDQHDPAAAMDAYGNFVIAWKSFGQDAPGGYGVYAQRFDRTGNPVDGEFRVNTTTAGIQQNPSVAMDASGNFVVAWESFGQDAPGGYGVYAQRFDRTGNPLGGEFRVNTTIADSQLNPSVSLNAAGNFVIAWQSNLQDGSGYGVYAQRFDPDGNPVGGEFKVNTHTDNNQSNPSVSMNAAGNFVIAWHSNLQDGSGYGVYAQRYDPDGNPRGIEFRANTFTDNNQDTPSVAMDCQGNFVIAWRSLLQDGSGYGVYAQRYDPDGNPRGIEFRANTYTDSHQDIASVAMDCQGNFVIAWESNLQDGNGNGVYARQYDTSGNPLGAEFRINTFSDGNQGNPALAMAPHGQWVIAWGSSDQDGSGEGVFMKLFIKNFGLYLPLILG